MIRSQTFLVLLLLALRTAVADDSIVPPAADTHDYVAGKLITLNDNGGWSWFMDERVIVADGKLIVGSVRSVKDFNSGKPDPNWGNVEVSALDLASGTVASVVLDTHFEQDDHDGPAFLPLQDGRLLAVYTRHGVERKVFYRQSAPHDPLTWGERHEFDSPGVTPPYRQDTVTYSNLYRVGSGRIYNFYRGVDHDPNYMFSDDDGSTWTYGGRMMMGRNGYSPYMKYVQDGESIHFVATEDHPRNFDNSLYHGMIRAGKLYQTNGTELAPLSTTTDTQVHTWDFTRVFPGDADNVAWMVDIELDAQRRPVILFSVQKDGRGLPPRQGGADIRYHYASWNGETWQQQEIAYAGTRLYPFEDDYSGLGAIDPSNANRIFISTDADPVTGEPLVSAADQRRHYELFEGTTADHGTTWRWTPITANSTVDNLRPLVPRWSDPRTALVWMRGTYKHNHGQWTTAVVALMMSPEQ
ncbi:MAG: BNR-4 repeat-containing protein [Planctomycetales bacterium]|nr:BNR-4 repeat-containing protein [Planctomycetales bacterium]MCA9166914.1 BNR-4 repeat-containing protein [Planctomycetales bacterium]